MRPEEEGARIRAGAGRGRHRLRPTRERMARHRAARRRVGAHPPTQVRVLSGAVERLRGLGAPGLDAGYAVLVPCRDIHTFGMARAIDAAFADASGIVVASYRGIAPKRRVRCKKARLVAERIACDDAWFAEGDSLFAMPSSGGLRAGTPCEGREAIG